MFDFMLSPPLQVLAVLAVSVVLFVSDHFRVDFVAILVLIALLLLDLIPYDDALSGFSSPAVVTVACMLIISAGLGRTGIVNHIGNRLYALAGRSTSRISSVLMLTCGTFSAFISNTATVAVLLPVSLKLAKERSVSASKLLMPLSFAAQFGGVCTLVGTTTNLIVNAIAQENGLVGFSMFEFAKLGLVCFVVGVVYMLIASKFLLKDKATPDGFMKEYRLQDYLTEMKVMEGSPLIGQKGGDNELSRMGDGAHAPRILDIFRDDRVIWAPQSTAIKEGDILLIRGDVSRVMDIASRLKLEDWPEGNLSEVHLKADDVSLMEVIIPAGSSIIGRSLSQLDFYWRYHAAVLGVRRRGEVLHQRISSIAFKEGDTLLLQGHKNDLDALASESDFMLLQDLSPLKLKTRRAYGAFLILCFVVLSAAMNVLPLLTASLIGAVAMVVTRCLSATEAYEALDFKVIVLLAGLIPLGHAMQNTGAVDYLVNSMVNGMGHYGPFVAMSGLYVVTVVLTSLMSNAATAVILAPLGIGLAESFSVSAEPFLIAVAFAASTCFSTPVGYQTNVMVMGPGGYKYIDYLKIGLPLNVIFFFVSIMIIPYFWPF